MDHAELDRRDPDWRKPTHVGAAVQALIDRGAIDAASLDASAEVEVRVHPEDPARRIIVHTSRSLATSDGQVADRDFSTARQVPDAVGGEKPFLERAAKVPRGMP